MSWQGQMGTMLRYLINDVDPNNYQFSDQRIETIILVAAQLTMMDAAFVNDYQVNVESCLLSPDPTDAETKDNNFVNLTVYRAACVMLGSQIRSEAGNAISIKDGPSAIDLRGVAGTLSVLYEDICSKYEKLKDSYERGLASEYGESVIGPFSPGSDNISRNQILGDFF
jgi:hypothetical protein